MIQKAIPLLLCFSLFFTACKKESTTVTNTSSKETQKELRSFRGEFIFLEDAAVLKSGNTMYAIDIDEEAKALAKQVATKKKNDYDMVEVIVKATVRPKPADVEGWSHILTIKEIVKVLERTGDTPIKIQSAQAQN